MDEINDEILQAYLDDELDGNASREVAEALATSPQLRERERALRDVMAECAWLLAPLSAEAASNLVRSSSTHAAQAGGRPSPFISGMWLLRAAAVLLVAVSGTYLWMNRGLIGASDRTDVSRLAVSLPGATRVASSVVDVGGQPVRRERFELSSGTAIDLDIMAVPRDVAFRGAVGSASDSGGRMTQSDSTDEGSQVTVVDKLGFVVQVRGKVSLSELKAIAERVALVRNGER